PGVMQVGQGTTELESAVLTFVSDLLERRKRITRHRIVDSIERGSAFLQDRTWFASRFSCMDAKQKDILTMIRPFILLGILCVGFFHVPALAAAFPERPIRFIVPFPPGGNTDVLSRLIAKGLTDKWGQQVIVDNRP